MLQPFGSLGPGPACCALGLSAGKPSPLAAGGNCPRNCRPNGSHSEPRRRRRPRKGTEAPVLKRVFARSGRGSVLKPQTPDSNLSLVQGDRSTRLTETVDEIFS